MMTDSSPRWLGMCFWASWVMSALSMGEVATPVLFMPMSLVVFFMSVNLLSLEHRAHARRARGELRPRRPLVAGRHRLRRRALGVELVAVDVRAVVARQVRHAHVVRPVGGQVLLVVQR